MSDLHAEARREEVLDTERARDRELRHLVTLVLIHAVAEPAESRAEEEVTGVATVEHDRQAGIEQERGVARPDVRVAVREAHSHVHADFGACPPTDADRSLG